MLADEKALGAADAGRVENQAHVAGEAEAARVRQTMAVEDEHVRFAAQIFQRGAQRGAFAKREQPWHVGEGGLADLGGFLDHGEIGE